MLCVRRFMQRIAWWLIAIAGLLLTGWIAYNAFQQRESSPSAKPPEPPKSAAPAMRGPPVVAQEVPQIQHPVPEVPTEAALPALDNSDATMTAAIAGLLVDNALVTLFNFGNFVRRVVVTVDNLPNEKLPARFMPVKPVGGKFAVDGDNEYASIAARNAARYAGYVSLAEGLDSAKLVAAYYHAYPLFQQAYRQLGYPQGHFNDRLVGVIDHLLAAPDLTPPVALIRPKVFYRYADPALELRSAGHKLLMRMGPDNARRIKVKLREIRDRIASTPSPPAESK